jgi:hypothetical protein
MRRKAYFWYEEQEPGLGEEFLRCVDACIQLIRRNPPNVPSSSRKLSKGCSSTLSLRYFL